MLSFAELHNLLKIPVLIEHFKEHRQLDPEISFFSFIKIHYFDPVVVDDDYQRDQQLPFRGNDYCIVHVSNTFECLTVIVDISSPNEAPRKFCQFIEVNKPRLFTFDIFQPPRCA